MCKLPHLLTVKFCVTRQAETFARILTRKLELRISNLLAYIWVVHRPMTFVTNDWLERLVSEMTCYVSSGTLNSTHSFTRSLLFCLTFVLISLRISWRSVIVNSLSNNLQEWFNVCSGHTTVKTVIHWLVVMYDVYLLLYIVIVCVDHVNEHSLDMKV